MMPDLRAVLIVDYQNVHLTGAGVFEPYQPLHEHLVHPLHFAHQILLTRNANQRVGHADAALRKVLVYRGLPSADVDPKPYARNLAQKAEWETDRRVVVTHRPLKYQYERDASGAKVIDEHGRWITRGKPQEKGIDVLCALALVREARDPATDLVILCSQDTDLEPALDEAIAIGSAKVETVSWYDTLHRESSREIRPSDRSRPIWNTRLNSSAFSSSRDPQVY